MRAYRIPLALAVVAAGVLLFATRGEERPPREPLRWGLYQIHWGRSFEPRLKAEVAKFATRPHYVMFYRDLGRPYPVRPIEAIRRVGATPIISLELWHWHGRNNPTRLDAIAKGEYDEFFARWARAAAEDGMPLLLRFGFEMNGDWFTWSKRPEEFVKAWRRVHAIFREQRAGHVAWVWCPNVVSVPDEPGNAMHLYYPGDDVVDWVALDGYNFGDHHDEWHEWQPFADVFAKPLDDLERRYPKKPVLIAETGCAPGDRRPEWIRAAHAWLQDRPRVKGLVWFHYDKRKEGEPDWRIDVTPESLKAFNETFARGER